MRADFQRGLFWGYVYGDAVYWARGDGSANSSASSLQQLRIGPGVFGVGIALAASPAIGLYGRACMALYFGYRRMLTCLLLALAL